MRTLLVVSGGDAPGVNAALYHYVRAAQTGGDDVYGAWGAFKGLLEAHLKPLRPGDLAPTMGQGGSYLPSSRVPVLKEAANREQLRSVLDAHGIDNILLFGGDGTLRNLPDILYSLQVPCLGIPATIDNDVPGSEGTLGFASACTVAESMIDYLLATARALRGRTFSVEVLGGHTGFLALAVARAAGADAVLVPEYPYDLVYTAERLRQAAGRQGWGLVVLSEGIEDSGRFAEVMETQGLRVRGSRLGHAQRGAPPVHEDRWLAAEMAELAYSAFKEGARQGTVVVQGGTLRLLETPISSLPRRLPERALYKRLNGL